MQYRSANVVMRSRDITHFADRMLLPKNKTIITTRKLANEVSFPTRWSPDIVQLWLWHFDLLEFF